MEMTLKRIDQFQGKIELVSGLHIGGGDSEMHIGGVDNQVIKNPITNEPYIPGSSLKGKMRSLMEMHAGVVGVSGGRPVSFADVPRLSDPEKGKLILKLFGGAPDNNEKIRDLISEVGPARLSFWDCGLDSGWMQAMGSKGLLLTEIKAETAINRISGTAARGSLRMTERVPAGAVFDFRLTVKVLNDENFKQNILLGLSLLELTGIGGSSSRGYGKFKFTELKYNNQPLPADWRESATL